MDEHINILYQFNEKYAPHAATSMVSVMENNKDADRLLFIVLGEDLSSDTVRRLEDMVEKYGRSVLFPETNKLLDDMKSLGVPAYRGSLAAGMRMFFQAILESLDIDDGLKIDRIIYLDSDTVVEGSLINLMNIDLQGKPVGMVIDSLSGSYKTTIGIPEDEPYYNSGVIIFDVDAWKDNKYSDQIIEELNKGNGKSANPDQDLLNTVCIGNIFTLPVIYNVQPIHLVFTPKQYFSCFSRENYYSEEELGCLQDSWIISGSDHYEEKGRNKQRDSEMRPVIYHFFRFMGEFPWNVGNTHPDRERYKYYLSLTPWKDKPDEPCDFGFISIVEKSLNRLLPAGLFIHIFHFAHNKYLSRKMEIN